MKKFTRIESHLTVNQYYNGKVVVARYEVTKRSNNNYQVDLYINGDYFYQWNNENNAEIFEGDKMPLNVAVNYMIFLSSGLFVSCEPKFITIHK